MPKRYLCRSMFFSYNDLKTFLPICIKGIVKDKSTGARLKDVLIFIKDEANEDFTDATGAFILQATAAKGHFVVEKEGYGHHSLSFSEDVYFIIQLERKLILSE